MKNTFPTAVQLYSVREQLNDNPRDCIATLANLGFTHAESFDLIQLSSIKGLLYEYSIEVNSSFLLWSHITGRYDLAEKIEYPWMPKSHGIEPVVDDALALGLDTLVCGYLLPEERNSIDCYKKLSDNLNRVGEYCQKFGIKLLYHNHAFEFQPMDSGFIPYQYLINNTEKNNLNFELDAFWAKTAGYEPNQVFAMLGDRLKQCHLKTGVVDKIPHYDDQTVTPKQFDYALGTGMTDIKSVINLALSQSIDRLYIEQDYSSNIYQVFAKSIAFLDECRMSHHHEQ